MQLLMRAHAPDVVAVKEEVQLCPAQIHHRIGAPRPGEARTLQALLPQHERKRYELPTFLPLT